MFSAIVSYQELGIAVSILYGASLTGALPLCIRACINYAPEIQESIPTNMIYVSAQIFSCIYSYPIQYCKELTTVTGFWIASLLIFLSFIGPFIFFYRFSEKILDKTSSKKINSTDESFLLKSPSSLLIIKT